MGRLGFTEIQCLYISNISLILLWSVQHLQSHRTCTVHSYLYSNYGPYGLYRKSFPVQYSYTSTPFGPYILYSASVPLEYSYNNNPPMGPKVSKGHNCLYSKSKHLRPL